MGEISGGGFARNGWGPFSHRKTAWFGSRLTGWYAFYGAKMRVADMVRNDLPLLTIAQTKISEMVEFRR